MTLIVALGNSEYVVQVADRRLIALGPTRRVLEDDATKAGAWTCADGRVLFGFSGLATAGGFDTQRFLLEQILACAKPDFQLKPTVERLKDALTQAFQTNPAISGLPRRSQRLSVMFTGYWDLGLSPCLVNLLLTNFQDFDSGADASQAWTDFRGWYFAQVPPDQLSGEPTIIQRIGAWPAVDPAKLERLRSRLKERQPARAVVGAVRSIFESAAASPLAAQGIGRRLSIQVLPGPRGLPTTADYAADQTLGHAWYPSQVVTLPEGPSYAVEKALIEVKSPSGTPGTFTVPVVGRNKPCPCGSGKKFKYCHGPLAGSVAA